MKVISVESVLYEELKLVELILTVKIAHLVAVQNIFHEAILWVTKLIMKIKMIMNKFAWKERIVNLTRMNNKKNTH